MMSAARGSNGAMFRYNSFLSSDTDEPRTECSTSNSRSLLIEVESLTC